MARLWLPEPNQLFWKKKNVDEKTSIDEILDKFKDFCLIDIDLTESTYERHKCCIWDFLKFYDGNISGLNKNDVRDYLKTRKNNEAKSTYANRIKALGRFFRDFLPFRIFVH